MKHLVHLSNGLKFNNRNTSTVKMNTVLFDLLITFPLSVQLSGAFSLDFDFEHVFAFSEQYFKVFRGTSNKQLRVQCQKQKLEKGVGYV